jgi:hypothetical protein
MTARTVADKLLIKANSTVWTSDTERRRLIEPLADGARYVDRPDAATTAVVFVDDAAAVRAVRSPSTSSWSALRFRPQRAGEAPFLGGR